jgi:hypothetical protein
MHRLCGWVRCSAVIGARCHLGFKSRRDTEAAAILYAVGESAKDSGVDPAAYLIEAARIAKRSGGDQHLMPWDSRPE